MPLGIVSNLPAGVARQNLLTSESSTATSIAKLSSGRDPFAARQAAAELAIASRLEANVSGLNQAKSNTVQASSQLKTAEGALSTTGDILTWLKSLSVQASSDQISDADRQALNAEFEQLRAEIDRTASATKVNEQSFDQPLSLDIKVGTGSEASDTISISLAPPTTASLGVDTVDISTKAGAAAASQAIDQAIDQVGSRSATLGAAQSRLSFAENNLSSTVANTKAAAANIGATNIPAAATELAQSQAQAKVGTEALAQANKRPGQLVNLLT
ncbi:MAG: hypothetical protein ISR48_11550 [Alphaproteobacteria bacterium]|nr:hypothetical protein [Alphaproteobacteria bacterium]